MSDETEERKSLCPVPHHFSSFGRNERNEYEIDRPDEMMQKVPTLRRKKEFKMNGFHLHDEYVN